MDDGIKPLSVVLFGVFERNSNDQLISLTFGIF